MQGAQAEKLIKLAQSKIESLGFVSIADHVDPREMIGGGGYAVPAWIYIADDEIPDEVTSFDAGKSFRSLIDDKLYILRGIGRQRIDASTESDTKLAILTDAENQIQVVATPHFFEFFKRA